MKKTNWKFLAVLAALGVAGLAWAVAEQRVDKYGGQFPVWFNKGLYVGTDTANPTASTYNKVAGIRTCTGDYDFPALTGSVLGLDTLCAESSAITCTGVKFTDTCNVGLDQVVVNAFGNFNAYVSATGAVKVRACADGITDGGTFNQPDSGYWVTCVSHLQ